MYIPEGLVLVLAEPTTTLMVVMAVASAAAAAASGAAQNKAIGYQQQAQQDAFAQQATANRIEAARQTEDLLLEREQYQEQARTLTLQAQQQENNRKTDLVAALSSNAAFAAARGITFSEGDTGDALAEQLSKLSKEDIDTDTLNVLQQKKQYLLGAERAGTKSARVAENLDLGLASLNTQSNLSYKSAAATSQANMFATGSQVLAIGVKAAGSPAVSSALDSGVAKVKQWWSPTPSTIGGINRTPGGVD